MGAMEESKSIATARLDCGWLPSLDEAATTLLFGFGSSPLVREYVSEMEQRLHEFVTIPSEVSDLTVHLESLANKYASEPMEIALLRFFEVVSSWKGVPELEEYKQGQTRPVSHSSHDSQSISRSDANGIVTIPALVCPVQVQAPSSFRSSPYNGIEQQQHSQHSRSPSIQSTSSMVHQSPGYHRHHLPLAPKRSDSRSAAAAAATATTSATTSPSVPSISIASLIHHHHPVVVPGEAKLLSQSHAHAQQQQPRQTVYSTNSLNPSMESMITEEEEEDEEEEEEESFRRLPLELFFTVPVQLRKARARARAAAARNSAATATAATVVGPSARTSPQTSLPVTPTGSMKSVNVPLLPSVDKLMVVVPAGTRDVGVGLGLTTTATATARLPLPRPRVREELVLVDRLNDGRVLRCLARNARESRMRLNVLPKRPCSSLPGGTTPNRPSHSGLDSCSITSQAYVHPHSYISIFPFSSPR
ncbi:hypothetical protein FS842_004918 [Serendipita sp. 407]|nr:hypothetical protein FS842_004918 [Serendipita sp. 407]